MQCDGRVTGGPKPVEKCLEERHAWPPVARRLCGMFGPTAGDKVRLADTKLLLLAADNEDV